MISSIGRATVSKTEGLRFDPLIVCKIYYYETTAKHYSTIILGNGVTVTQELLDLLFVGSIPRYPTKRLVWQQVNKSQLLEED